MSVQEDEEETKRIRHLLNFHYKKFVQDLTVGRIVPELLQQLILEYEDKQLIDNEVTYESKAQKLVDILLEKSERNPKALPAFKHALLQNDHKWLHEKLTEDVPDHEPVGRMRPEMALSHSNGTNGREFKPPKEPSKRGWVQSLPPINIERPELLESVTEKISSLKPGHYLVIHGMPGSGKTVLATQVIRNMCRDHQRSHEDEVYWLSIGKDSGDSNDALIDKMRILCEKLNINRAPESVDHGKEILRDALVTRGPVLLVLDNVWNSKVIKAFDVGFRTIVTTRDASVMDVVNGRLSHSIHITEGFSEIESLKFFCEALKVPKIEDLPSHARLIHRECKGSPMTISLIASLLQDHQANGVSDDSRWEYYYESLSKRKYSSLRRDRFYEHASISDAISLSFESLSEKDKNFYLDFALFQHDVSVPCKVLETLWNVTKWKAEDIMKRFVQKNLAIEEYDDESGSYKYSLHDLLLDDLKTRVDAETEKALHEKLIRQYEDKCNLEFYKLPNDGYIHFHVGYHLYKAGRTDLFPSIYLDLKFVGEKLKITGPADLLLDFRKYASFITAGNPENEKLLDELEELTNQVGYRLYGQPDIDIMQVAIQSPHLRSISALAKEYGKRTPNRLFLEWKNTSSCQGKSPEITVSVGDYVRCAKFVGCEGRLFIVGLSNGEIKLCDLKSSAVYYIFRGHSDSVNSLSVFCPEHLLRKSTTTGKSSHIFASASDDKTCRLWELDTVLSQIEDSHTVQPPSTNSHRRPSVIPESKLRFGFHSAAVTSINFFDDGEKLVSTSPNEILVWSVFNGTVLQKISTSEDETCQFCLFPPNRADYILGVSANQIWIYSTKRGTLCSHVNGHHMKIVGLLWRSNESFCTVSENEIAIWDVSVGPLPQKNAKQPLSPCVSVSLTNGSVRYEHTAASGRNVPHENLLSVPEFFPGDVAGKRSSRTSDDLGASSYTLQSGRNSPGITTDCYSTGPVTTYIDTPDCGRIQISRGRVLTKKSRGFFTCAALDKKNGELLACGTWDQKIALFQLDEMKFLGEFSAHFGAVTTLCFSPVDEYALLSGSGDETVKIWDLKEEEKENTEPQKTGVFASVCIDDRYFISVCATERKTIQVLRDSEVAGETQAADDSISAIALLRDGTQAAAGTIKGQVLWMKNIRNQGDVQLEMIGNQSGEVIAVQFSLQGDLLASASLENILVFKEFAPLRMIRSNTFKINSFHFCFRDTALAVCNEDGLIEIHKVIDKGSSGWPTSSRISCSLMSSNSLFVGTEEDGIHMFSLGEDHSVDGYYTLDCKHHSPIRSLALSVTEDRLAVGHENGLITVWNISRTPPTEEIDLILHKSRVRHLSFASNEPPWLLSCGDHLALWTLDKPVEKIRRPTFMEERRRRKSGESVKTNNRLSLQIPMGQKIGRQGKRELLQAFMFRGNFAQNVATNSTFTKFFTVDNFGVLYELEVLPSQVLRD